MNEHQIRLWNKMVSLIDSYVKNEYQDFYTTVGELEGALNASEIKDIDLIEKWYDHWTPLEIRRSIEGNKINRIKAIEELMKMREFLIKYL